MSKMPERSASDSPVSLRRDVFEAERASPHSRLPNDLTRLGDGEEASLSPLRSPASRLVDHILTATERLVVAGTRSAYNSPVIESPSHPADHGATPSQGKSS